MPRESFRNSEKTADDVTLKLDNQSLKSTNAELTKTVVKLQQENAELQERINSMHQIIFKSQSELNNYQQCLSQVKSVLTTALPRFMDVGEAFNDALRYCAVLCRDTANIHNRETRTTQAVKPHAVNGTIILSPTIRLSRSRISNVEPGNNDQNSEENQRESQNIASTSGAAGSSFVSKQSKTSGVNISIEDLDEDSEIDDNEESRAPLTTILEESGDQSYSLTTQGSNSVVVFNDVKIYLKQLPDDVIRRLSQRSARESTSSITANMSTTRIGDMTNVLENESINQGATPLGSPDKSMRRIRNLQSSVRNSKESRLNTSCYKKGRMSNESTKENSLQLTTFETPSLTGLGDRDDLTNVSFFNELGLTPHVPSEGTKVEINLTPLSTKSFNSKRTSVKIRNNTNSGIRTTSTPYFDVTRIDDISEASERRLTVVLPRLDESDERKHSKTLKNKSVGSRTSTESTISPTSRSSIRKKNKTEKGKSLEVQKTTKIKVSVKRKQKTDGDNPENTNKENSDTPNRMLENMNKRLSAHIEKISSPKKSPKSSKVSPKRPKRAARPNSLKEPLLNKKLRRA